ncbi:MAG: smc 6 [Gemmataceae bacterium]|nr:smc 6 [Gemmataceae bacterium]
MRVRHKTPTLVSMWMLDVFCCALGCVTLLWLLNTRQAGDQTAAAQSALTDLAQVRTDLKLALTSLDSTKLRLNSEVQQFTTQLAAIRTEKDDTARKLGIARAEAKSAQAQLDATKTALNAAEAKVDATAKELASAREKADDAEDVLRKKQKEADTLAKKAKEAVTTADELQRLIRKKDEERAALDKRATDLQKMLDDVTAKLAASKKDLDAAAATAKTTSTKAAEDLTTTRGQIKDLQKKIDEANTTIIDLQGEKAKLADKVDKVVRETENRFAGITITGKSVVFLVDMSGSMDKIDLQTAAPHKWPVVCETVAKVMRTVPTLERYQVVVFSSQARWLAGTGGQWEKYEGEKSAAAVKAALLKVKPEGDTNLHAAFDLAFSLRTKGLDTVYLFSDGLPTSGPGLTPAQENVTPPLEETKRGEILGKYLRDKLRATWNRKLVGDDRVKIHAIGFFFESPDVGAFLWALARENDGSFVGMSRP